MCFLLLPLTWKIVSVWAFRFSRDGIAEVIARTLTATPPRYSTIKELDRKIREFYVTPDTLDLIRGGPGVDPQSVPLSASMLAYMLSTLQDVSKLSPLPDTVALRAEQKKNFECCCFFIATSLSRPSSKIPMTR